MGASKKFIHQFFSLFLKNGKNEINSTETSYKKSKHATKNLLEKNLRTENSTFKKKKSSLFFANFNFDCDSYFFFVLKNNFFKNSMEHTYYYYYIDKYMTHSLYFLHIGL